MDGEAAARAQVIVLNGGSSSGKSGIARCLQALLPDAWLAIGVDTLIDVMPARLRLGSEGIGFALDGEVTVGGEFRSVNNKQFEGLVRFSTTPPGGAKDGPRLSGATWTPNVSDRGVTGNDPLPSG